jgi:hypothetical protein
VKAKLFIIILYSGILFAILYAFLASEPIDCITDACISYECGDYDPADPLEH